MKQLNFFRAICGVCCLCFTLTTFIPLATLAIELANIPEQVEDAKTVVNGPQEEVPRKKYPQAGYFLDEVNYDPALADGRPVFDVFTVTERKTRNLPTALPKPNYYYGEKTVYLTFDDGPDPENTPHILAILREEGIKATFFVVGNQVEQHPEILQQIYQEGHAIGNHSYDHIYSHLYQTAETYVQQLHKSDEIVQNVLGVRPRISRAPGGSAGSFTKEYWQLLKKEGYIEVGWNVSSGDASSAKAQQLVNNILSQMDNIFLWSHAIVLMHDGRGHGETVKALPHIIKIFKDRGFEFRVVNTQTPPAW